MNIKLSLVVPCFNEEQTVQLFQDAVINAFADCGFSYEIVFVNDGSRDNTLFRLKKIFEAQRCPVKVVSFSRNFGKESALYAGLAQASGEYISLIDADLQQRPEIVLDMVKILDEKPEYDVVAAYQDRRGESAVLKFFKRSFYTLINKLSAVKLHPDASDFRTFRRCVAENILELGEYHRFSKGIFAWVGYETKWLEFENVERTAGETKWSFLKLLHYSIDGIMNFSNTPIRLSSYLGLLLTAVSFVAIIVEVIRALVFGDPVAGWPSLVCIITFIGGIQLFCMGIMGQYISKTYMEVKRRPHYIVKETNCVDADLNH